MNRSDYEISEFLKEKNKTSKKLRTLARVIFNSIMPRGTWVDRFEHYPRALSYTNWKNSILPEPLLYHPPLQRPSLSSSWLPLESKEIARLKPASLSFHLPPTTLVLNTLLYIPMFSPGPGAHSPPPLSALPSPHTSQSCFGATVHMWEALPIPHQTIPLTTHHSCRPASTMATPSPQPVILILWKTNCTYSILS